MKRINVFIQRIEKAQHERALAALATPRERDAFEYGRVSGEFQGLERAKEIVLAILDEEENGEQRM